MPRKREKADFDRPAQRVSRHRGIWAPLEGDPTFVLRTMFGSKAVYIGGRLVLAFCEGDEPWRGILVATEKAHHESLRQDIRGFVVHPVLKKWLYLPEEADEFEVSADRLVRLIQNRDPRIGVAPKPRKKRSSVRPE